MGCHKSYVYNERWPSTLVGMMLEGGEFIITSIFSVFYNTFASLKNGNDEYAKLYFGILDISVYSECFVMLKMKK